MKFPIYLNDSQVEKLQYEVLSDALYVYLTRQLILWCEEDSSHIRSLIRKNVLINLSRSITGGKIFTLTSDDDGEYHSADYAWHEGQIFLILREFNTVEFIEFTAQIIYHEYISADVVNEALEKEGASFRFLHNGKRVSINVMTIEDLIEREDEFAHPNIRLLVDRLDNAYNQNDYTLVLHTSACIFETLAKDIISSPSIQNESLGGFFSKYKSNSSLPDPILDYILSIYKERGLTHLAAHGGLTTPNISMQSAATLLELTKSFVNIEYRLRDFSEEK